MTLGCLSNEHHYIYFYLLPFLFVPVEAWQKSQVNPPMAARTELAKWPVKFPCSRWAGQVFKRRGFHGLGLLGHFETGSRSRQKKTFVEYCFIMNFSDCIACLVNIPSKIYLFFLSILCNFYNVKMKQASWKSPDLYTFEVACDVLYPPVNQNSNGKSTFPHRHCISSLYMQLLDFQNATVSGRNPATSRIL